MTPSHARGFARRWPVPAAGTTRSLFAHGDEKQVRIAATDDRGALETVETYEAPLVVATARCSNRSASPSPVPGSAGVGGEVLGQRLDQGDEPGARRHQGGGDALLGGPFGADGPHACGHDRAVQGGP